MYYDRIYLLRLRPFPRASLGDPWTLVGLQLVIADENITCFLCVLRVLQVLFFRFFSFFLDCCCVSLSFTFDSFSILTRDSTSSTTVSRFTLDSFFVLIRDSTSSTRKHSSSSSAAQSTGQSAISSAQSIKARSTYVSIRA